MAALSSGVGGWVLALVAGCSGGGPDCAALTGEAQAECRFEEVKSQVDRGDLAGADASIARMGDPLAQDLVRLRLAIRAPESAARWCAAITTEPAAGQCARLLGRPHLRSGP